MHITPHPELWIDSSIAWFYLITNTLRVVTYVPQIVAVMRSQDGARAVSLFTWGSWMVANGAAILYALLLRDFFFMAISSINFLGCSAVTLITIQRRARFEQSRAAVATATPVVESHVVHDARADDFGDTMAFAYLDASVPDSDMRDAWPLGGVRATPSSNDRFGDGCGANPPFNGVDRSRHGMAR